jgi:molybdopterin-guanine dinucleotide biosynthesis protein A
VVLAGGRGSRFGSEGKATVELARRPLLGYVLEALTGALDEVAVAAKASTALPGSADGETLRVPGSPRVALWTEPDEPHHPLAGLRYALQRAGERAVLAVAVDMPLITAPLVAEIARADAAGALAVVPITGTRLQPLLARYERGALEVLEAAGENAPLTAAVQALNPRTIEVADPELFFNVNSYADVKRAETELRLRRRRNPA